MKKNRTQLSFYPREGRRPLNAGNSLGQRGGKEGRLLQRMDHAKTRRIFGQGEGGFNSPGGRSSHSRGGRSIKRKSLTLRIEGPSLVDLSP